MLQEERVRCVHILKETDAATVSVVSVYEFQYLQKTGRFEGNGYKMNEENRAINSCLGKRRIPTDTHSWPLYHLVRLVLTGKIQILFCSFFNLNNVF